jgi:hypothetical protein
VSKKKALAWDSWQRKEAQRKVMEYARRIVYLSSEGVGGDLEQRTDTITAKLGG